MVIIGAGGFAKELIQVLISDKYAYNEKNMFFFDDINDIAGELFNRFTMLTSTEQVKQIFQNISPDFCLGIGSPKGRYTLCKKFGDIGGKVKTIIAPNTTIGTFGMEIGEGVTIMNRTTVSNAVKVGKCALINVNVMIGHDSIIGDYCDISPGVIITGHSKVGKYVQLGSGSIILPGVKIGQNSIISAGSVISQDVPENSKVVGTIPSRVIEKLSPFLE